MATTSKPVGYECEFVDQIPEDYFCKQCKHVAREPNITSCCGEVLCKGCVDLILQDKEPCPSCENIEISAMPHAKYHHKILALEVHCAMKDCGCQWTRQLQHLDAHLHVTNGDCQYVDVDCPKQCDQKVQKRNVDTHLADYCPNRNYMCQHCNFRDTFQIVSEHFEVCPYYPLACSNRCGVSFERGDLEDHMRMCRLEEVQCVFSDAGCQAKFIRDNEDEHMEQNTQKHLALMAATTLRTSQDFESKLLGQQEVFERKFQDIEGKLQEQQQEFQHKQEVFEKKLQDKDEQIKAVQEQFETTSQILKQQQLNTVSLIHREVGFPPHDFTLSNFQQLQTSKGYCDSQPMYTHPISLKFCLRILPNGFRSIFGSSGSGTHVSVRVYSFRCVSLAMLQFTITLQLLNQYRDQDHYTRDIQCRSVITYNNMGGMGGGVSDIGHDNTFIPHTDLEWNADKQTQYLKDDCLRFTVTKVTIQ